jgi:branched-chain amino acid transport system ATP-binding protein
MDASAEIILEAQGIHAWYDSSHVLHGVNLEIRKGETVGLLGRNGMGKSTLIRTLLGHVTQRDGHISLFGHDISRARPHQVARLGVAYVPEGRGIFGNLTVRENLVMASRKGRDDRNDWTLERVLHTFPRLAERLNNLGSQLSGGEQQMLALGRALVGGPRLLLVDELSLGLAPLIVQAIYKQLLVVGQTLGTSMLIVEQNARVALEFASSAYILDRGQITLSGSADEVRNSSAMRDSYLGTATDESTNKVIAT